MSTTPRVLVIDDNPDDRLLTIRALRRTFDDIEVCEIADRRTLAEALEVGDFDAVITDLILNWSDGLDVLRESKARYPDRPVIMFTRTGNQEVAVEAMKSGLDDYVVKSPSHFVRVPVALQMAFERAHARRRAAEVEERFHLMVDNARDFAFIMLDPDGLVTAWMGDAERIFGYAEAEILGRHSSILRTPEDRASGEQDRELERAAREGRVEDDSWVAHKDGTRLWVSGLTVALHNGELRGFAKIVRDQTEHRRAEIQRDRLLEREQATRRRVVDILESINDAFFTVDHEWRFTYINREAERLWGRPRDEMLGRIVRDEFPQAVGSEPYQQILRAATEGSTTKFESVSPILGMWIGGTVYPSHQSISVYFQDITERKKAEEELKTRTRQQEVVANVGRRALMQRELGLLLEETVEAVAATLGVEYCKVLELLPGSEELRLVAGIGWSEGSVGHATVGSGTDSQAGYTLLSDQPVIVTDLRTEQRFSGPSVLHEHGVVSGMSVVIGGETGPYGVLGAHSRRRVDFSPDDANFLQAVANVLATAIRRKNFEERIATERAEAARLDELTKLRSEFISSISHDLKTPLTAISSALGLVELSVVDRLQHDERELFQNARRNTDRLGMLIEQLLTFNELHAGTLELDRQPIDLRGVVFQAVDVVYPLIQGKGQKLEMDLPGPLPFDGDAMRLADVLINILGNAHKHTPPGTHILVSGKDHSEGLVLTVRDNGQGIPPDEVETIFERSRTLSPATGGSGLGLAIARGIVELHGGRLWAQSNPGQGTGFHIELPAARRADDR